MPLCNWIMNIQGLFLRRVYLLLEENSFRIVGTFVMKVIQGFLLTLITFLLGRYL